MWNAWHPSQSPYKYLGPYKDSETWHLVGPLDESQIFQKFGTIPFWIGLYNGD